MYRPTPGGPTISPGCAPATRRYLLSVPGEQPGTIDKLAIWWLPPSDPAAPTLLYLHGTFRTLYRNYPKIEALRAAGFGVLAVDYRGWGDSTAIVPSEKTILADADVAWTELVRHQPEPKMRVIYGHSLGGAVAIDLASRKHGGTDYAALIVESTFTNLADLAAPLPGRWARSPSGSPAKASIPSPRSAGSTRRSSCCTATMTTPCRSRSAARSAMQRRPACTGSRSRAAATAGCTRTPPSSIARR